MSQLKKDHGSPVLDVKAGREHFNGQMSEKDHRKLLDMLCAGYNMEIESVCNYLANSIHLDGIRAKDIRDSLAQEVQDELGHAQRLAKRIHILHGRVPGSRDLKMMQATLQPPDDSHDLRAIIQGVIDAEMTAIDHYQRLIDFTDHLDLVTQEMCIELKGEEEEHLRLFDGFLVEAESMKV